MNDTTPDDGFPFPPLAAIPVRSTRRHETTPPEPIRRQVQFGQFPNELGVPVALPELVITAPQVCIALDTFFVHRDGVHAVVRVVHRDPMAGSERESAGTFYVHPTEGLYASQKLWRIGLVFADGRKAATPSLQATSSNDDFILMVTGGGGGQADEQHRAYISPVPPAGPLTLHVDLGEAGVYQATADATPLQEAERLAEPIWPTKP